MRALKVLPVLLLLLVGACAEEDATAPDASSLSPAFGKASALTPIEMLGKSIYFDTNLSLNRNQACATCHDPAADQALGPFLNPVEQALPDNACVVYRVCNGGYPVGMDEVWGPGTCDIAWPNNMDKMCEKEGKTIKLSEADLMKVDAAYDQVGLSIAAFEGSSEVNAYTSKFDAYLAGMVKLTKQERQGLALFNSMKAKCAACHILDAGPNGEPPLFTDFTFDNLGIPINTMNPNAFADPGLGGFLATRPEWAADVAANLGKHKVPTLRNLDKRPYPGFVRAYGHNGYFKSIAGIVHFYNTRDVKDTCPGPYTEAEALAANCWPAPEVAANVNTAELGDLGLKPEHEAAIVAFLKTLNDGYMK